MPRYSRLSRSSTICDAITITQLTLFDYLAPTTLRRNGRNFPSRCVYRSYSTSVRSQHEDRLESLFFSSLSRASTCPLHKTAGQTKRICPPLSAPYSSEPLVRRRSRRNTPRQSSKENSGSNKVSPETDEANAAVNNLFDPLETSTSKSNGDRRQRRPLIRGQFFNSHAQGFADGSHLPQDFFSDVENLQSKVQASTSGAISQVSRDLQNDIPPDAAEPQPTEENLKERLSLLHSVRSLEAQLATAKAELHKSMQKRKDSLSEDASRPVVTLSKEDYLGLVDLYYYTHKNRFSPESPDSSPTPLFLDDYSFRLSADFSQPIQSDIGDVDEELGESPLKEVEQMLKSRQIREISLMQTFVDLLLNDSSSTVALFEIYKKFPPPGVSYLPKGILRLFLQRMSTPWTRSEKAMLRYLSLIDDMQKAGLRITLSEWSSAIYLAGRSFSRVVEGDLSRSFRIWNQMEKEAGVQASNVTFNILFDIAVRAGKFVLAEAVLREMHDRGFKLNRLGRVSLIFYHGLRGDGDAVRKTYRDFVEAGEIVDTLVLNCVISSLINAQEPTAAEQTYERMKDLQSRLQKGIRSDGESVLYMRYPPPGSTLIDREMASNSLDRVLLRTAHLKSILPEHHSELQGIMPLTPDYTTFRSMISYHANTSGDLNRLTVLMNEQTELFGLPFTSMNFQLLFKGFALHGASRSTDSQWNSSRLDMAWDACRNAVKDAQAARKVAKGEKEDPKTLLPTVKQLEAADREERERQQTSSVTSVAVHHPAPTPKLKRLSSWDNFVLDLAAFPRERRRPIERIHAQLFDDESVATSKPAFFSPFFQATEQSKSSPQEQQQETYYAAGDHVLDSEEGEYILPPPSQTANPSSQDNSQTPNPQESSETDAESESYAPHEIRINRPLICWLLRAYTRCYGTRTKVEEIWNSARKFWKPLDEMDRDSVFGVLRRCLRDCDRNAGGRGI